MFEASTAVSTTFAAFIPFDSAPKPNFAADPPKVAPPVIAPSAISGRSAPATNANPPATSLAKKFAGL